jgi:hypothetical protein
MSEKNELQIKFRIHHIETLQYALMQEHITQDKLSYGINFGYGIDARAMIVRSSFRYEMLSESKPCLIIEVAVDFMIDKESFEEQILKGNKLILDKNFATHLATITVGTARGILHEKTKESTLNAYPIPTINVTSQIQEDISLDNQ